jgi:hypothetical protein
LPHSTDPNDFVELRAESDELYLEVNLPSLNTVLPTTRLEICADDLLVVLGGAMQGGVLECLRENDRVKYIRSGGRVVFTRVEGAR